MGPNVNGAPPQAFQDPHLMPPAAIQVSPRELLTFLRTPDQVGYPGTLDTDACVGLSVMAYQAWEILYGYRGAASFNLVRLSSPVAEGRDAPKHTPTQGLCPCCAVATHVAVPGPHRLGPYDHLKHTGLRRWAEAGHWAPRRLAAIGYMLRFNDRIPLPSGWDGAANSPEFTPPNALVRGIYLGDPRSIPTVAQANAVPTLTRECEPEKPKIAPEHRRVARETEPGEQKMAPEQPFAPKRPTTAAPSRLDTLIPRDAQTQPASSSAGMDQAATSAGHHKLGHSAGTEQNLFRGKHWRGRRRPKPRGDTQPADQYTVPPSAPSSWPSHRNNWSNWKK